VEGLKAQFLAKGRQSFKTFGSHKTACVAGYTVHDRGCVLKEAGEMAKKHSFNFSKIRRLSHEGNVGSRIGKKMSVKTLKEPKQLLIRFTSEVFTNDFHGKDFAVS
jgi:hypothetical protein